MAADGHGFCTPLLTHLPALRVTAALIIQCAVFSLLEFRVDLADMGLIHALDGLTAVATFLRAVLALGVNMACWSVWFSLMALHTSEDRQSHMPLVGSRFPGTRTIIATHRFVLETNAFRSKPLRYDESLYYGQGTDVGGGSRGADRAENPGL